MQGNVKISFKSPLIPPFSKGGIDNRQPSAASPSCPVNKMCRLVSDEKEGNRSLPS